MRIGIYTDNMCRGGIETYFLNLIEGLHDRIQFVFFYHAGGELAEVIAKRYPHVELHQIPFAPNIWKLTQLFKAHNLDVIHSHKPHLSYISAIASRLAGIPRNIMHVHGHVMPNKRFDLYRTLATPFIDELLVCSQCVKDHVLQHIPSLSNRTDVVYNGIPLPEPAQPPQDIFRIGFVGLNFVEKGLPTLLKAGEILLQHNIPFELSLIGIPKIHPEWEFHPISPELQQRIHCHGKLTPEQVWSTLHTCHTFTLPAQSESFGISILEAMGMGIPPICTNVGGIPEIIDHNKNGFLIPLNDHKTLADTLLKLFNNPQLRDTIGDAGREKVATTFSLSAMEQTMSRIYFNCHKQGDSL